MYGLKPVPFNDPSAITEPNAETPIAVDSISATMIPHSK
jgi:hypothetical protein